MPFDGKTPGPGRPPGLTNKLTKTVREAVLIAFLELQDSEEHKLTAWAKDNLTDFYKIAAKLIPVEIQAKIKQVDEFENWDLDQINAELRLIEGEILSGPSDKKT